MPRPIRTPRINNNDDSVRLIHIAVEVGAQVRTGDYVAEVETDKASFSVESEDAGFVLSICHKTGEEIPVGSVLFWLGDSADESAPSVGNGTAAKAAMASISLKAQLLLRKYRLEASEIQNSGERLSAEDVENHIKFNGLALPADASFVNAPEAAPTSSGRTQELNPEERGMLRTVLWHRDSAVTGYLELPYDPKPWADYAARFQTRHKLMFNPLLSLLSYRLSGLAQKYPVLNSTIVGHSRYVYDHVNLGFTVQAGATLYMIVVRNAEAMTEQEFAAKLTELQMSAMKQQLRAEDATGATLAFTSMARWSIARHIPILPPHVSFIAAHVAPHADGSSILGATYDHRALTGFDAAQVLRDLARPPMEENV